jgi:transketolase
MMSITPGPRTSSMMALRKAARRRLLQMHFESGVGHIGGNLSCLDILLELFHHRLTDSDQFVLSKGHAAGALYITLWSKGLISESQLGTFHKDATLLSGHPPAFDLPGVSFATGSLGHGLSLASGLALSARWQDTSGAVFCLTSDGEWNEGSMWEALIFATHQNLNQLVVIIDQNGLQGFGSTAEVADLSPLAEKFRAFGLTVLEVDGHAEQILPALTAIPEHRGPLIVLARTVKGKGVSFMENRMEWHYLPLRPEQYAYALSELKR